MKYVGKHEAFEFEGTKYLGSGVYIVEDIKRLGKDQFIVELLEECETEDDLMEAEEMWIQELDAVNDPLFYNAKLTSLGGNTYKNFSEEKLNSIKQKISEKSRGVPKSEEHRRKHSGENAFYWGKKRDPEHIEKMRQSLIEHYKTHPNPFKGKKHSEETKQWMRDHQPDKSGKNNPMYGKSAVKGKVYVNNGLELRVVSPEVAEELIKQGWNKGRLKK